MTATAIAAVERPVGPVLEDVLARAADPELWERFERQLRSSGYCRRPVRLSGRVDAIDLTTGECETTYSTEREPDGTLLKCCGNRREAVCPSCAERYRGDAYQLVAAGLRGGKGVPESVAEHPMVFLTVTAPSFGLVHSRRLVHGEPQRCRPRRRGEVCRHGVRLSCGEIHGEGDPRLGEPLCPECFDYEHAVLWNALAPELWRRTAIQIPRELARLCGLSHRELRRRARVSYVKVAEYQRRGALHFHGIVRLDHAQPRENCERVEPPSGEFTCELLARAVLAAVEHVSVDSPTPEPARSRQTTLVPEDGRGAGRSRTIRWGLQTEIRGLELGSSPREAAACAAYIAKYATKSAEAVGGIMHRLGARDLTLRVRPHVRRYIECAWQLAAELHLRGLRLRRWAHALGFRGHCFTKSRHYSTTFTALRRARHEHVLRRLHGGEPRDPWGRPMTAGASCERGRFRGIGYRTLGDAWLAECAAARAREQRQVAHEELRTAPVGAVVGRANEQNGRRS
jgi:hypothetical protein